MRIFTAFVVPAADELIATCKLDWQEVDNAMIAAIAERVINELGYELTSEVIWANCFIARIINTTDGKLMVEKTGDGLNFYTTKKEVSVVEVEDDILDQSDWD